MSEVETDFAFVDKLACLLDMSAENIAQCGLKKVSTRMVAHNRFTPVGINFCDNLIPYRNYTI